MSTTADGSPADAPEPGAVTSTLRVRDALRAEILSGRIPLGSRLRAEAVAERYEVSRTPAREAFMLLAREGLLEIVPRRGAIVRSFDTDDVLELYSVKVSLEPFAARLAATRATPEQVRRLAELCDLQDEIGAGTEEQVARQMVATSEFHTLILEAAGSHRLIAALSAAGALPATFRSRFWHDDDHRRQSLHSHRLLVDAIRHGQPDYAETIMRMHLQAAMALVAVHRTPLP
ncbi:MAG: GntR family transcriptional regulator [Aeromicrobium sp.]